MEEEVLQRDLDSAARGSWKIREMENGSGPRKSALGGKVGSISDINAHN